MQQGGCPVAPGRESGTCVCKSGFSLTAHLLESIRLGMKMVVLKPIKNTHEQRSAPNGWTIAGIALKARSQRLEYTSRMEDKAV